MDGKPSVWPKKPDGHTGMAVLAGELNHRRTDGRSYYGSEAKMRWRQPTIKLLDLDFTNAEMPAVVSWLGHRAADAPFGYVVTPNADLLVRIIRDPSLLPIYRNSLLCLMDSTVVARSARLLSLRTAPVVRGTDLVEVLQTQYLGPVSP